MFEYVADDGKCVRSEVVGKVQEFVQDAGVCAGCSAILHDTTSPQQVCLIV